KIDLSDPIMHQSMKIIFLVPRVSKEDSGLPMPPIIPLSMSRAVATLCVRGDESPVTEAFGKIPALTLEALSPTPHFLATSSVAVPAFVSPAFSAKMRRVIAGMVLSFAQRQYHPTATASSPLEADIGVRLCIRQIVTLSHFFVQYGQDATHLYDLPLLSRDTVGLPVGRTPGSLPGEQVHSHRRRSAHEIPLVGQELRDRGLLAVCRTHSPIGFHAAFTWQDKLVSGNRHPLSSNLTARYIRQMTDTICFSGSVSHMLPVQLEFPGLCQHCWNNQDGSWLGVDVMRRNSGSESVRTGHTSHTNKTSQSKRSMRSHQSSSAVSVKSSQSRASVASMASSGYSAAKTKGSTNRKPVAVTSPGLTKAMDHVAEYGQFRIALYYPDSVALQMTAVTEPISDIEAIVQKRRAAYRDDGMKCASYDAFGIINVQDIRYTPSQYERLRKELSDFDPSGGKALEALARERAAKAGDDGPPPEAGEL
ncbi:hypothetical protein KIPB_011271, partial [Kipferlia bialata]